MSRLHRYLKKHSDTSVDPGALAYLCSLELIEQSTPKIAEAIINELRDQRSHIKLIASENYSSLPVQLAMGNLLTDKYAEGYAHHRFYAGCDNIDIIEDQAERKLIELFKSDCAYAQPHSGSDANLIAFWSILVHKIQSPEIERLGKKTLDQLTPDEYEKIRQLLINQKILGMSLNAGGHLTHGYRHNVSAKMFQAISYDLDPKTELLDYKKIEQQVKQEKPLILLAGYSAYPRKINFAKMKEIADTTGATLMVDMAHFAGLVAGKAFTGEYDPIPYADIVTSTTHKTLRGPRGGIILCRKEYGDVVNKGCPLVLGGPLPHVMAAKAIAFDEANTQDFREYSQQILKNAVALANQLKSHGIRLITGGTENHLVIFDLSNLGLTGRHGENALRQAGITVNRNAIPFDNNGPWYTSGLRIGSPAMTTLGMKEDEMRLIADLIVEVLKNTKPKIVERTGEPSRANCETSISVLEKVKGQVKDLLSHYPLYPEIDIS